MKRLLLLTLAVSLAVGAYPGMTGGRGLFRVQDARSTGKWNGSLMLQGIFGSFGYDQIEQPGQIGLQPGERLTDYDLVATLGLSPIDWFELFCWSGAVIERTPQYPDSLNGWHNLMPGLKLSLPTLQVVKLGALGAWSMYPILDDFRGGWSWGHFGLPFVNGPVWTGLATFVLGDGMPTLHLNYGQAYDADDEVRTIYSTLGAAVEYEIGKLDLFAEFASVQADGSPFDNSGRMYLTPGVKVGYLRPLIVEAGLSLGLTDYVPDLELIAGIGLSGRVFTPPKRTTGTIAGRVLDAATGSPLAATVSFPGEQKPAPISTDGRKGTFTAKGVRPGNVLVRATAPGYLPVEEAVSVSIGRTSPVEFALRAEKTTGTIAGKVTDPSTGAALTATVEFPGSALAPVTTGKDGFRIEEVTGGEYRVEASADGYLTASTKIMVRPEQVTRADFELVRKGIKITLKVLFDFDQATLRPESHAALEAAAKIMKENPAIRVEIQGHTDSKGTAEYNQRLSEQRAQAVVDYLVDKLGIDRARLTAKGFGLSKPVATNETEEGQAQNRRAEFHVVE